VNNGLARRSWARNEGAEFAISRAMQGDERLDVIIPNIVDRQMLDKILDSSR